MDEMTWFYTSQHEYCSGVNSSCHIRTNMSIRRDIICNIGVHSIHKEEVLHFSIIYVHKDYQEI